MLARGHVYKENILCDAPRAVSAQKNGAEVGIIFRNADGGLYVTGNTIEALKLYVSEAEELSYTFRIEDNQLILALPGVEKDKKDKIQIKFAQTPWFTVNLYNQAGIPAVPFEFVC